MRYLPVVVIALGAVLLMAGCFCNDRALRDQNARARGAIENGNSATASEILKGEK